MLLLPPPQPPCPATPACPERSRRVDAIVVYALIGIVTAVAALPSFLAGVFVPGYSPRIFPFGAYFGTFAGLLFVLYFTCAEATYGKTLGKRVMGLHVSTEGGAKPALGVSFLRNLSKINWALLLLDVRPGGPWTPDVLLLLGWAVVLLLHYRWAREYGDVHVREQQIRAEWNAGRSKEGLAHK